MVNPCLYSKHKKENELKQNYVGVVAFGPSTCHDQSPSVCSGHKLLRGAGGEAQCNTTLWSLKHKHKMVNKHKHSTLDIKHKNNMLVTEKHKHSGH